MDPGVPFPVRRTVNITQAGELAGVCRRTIYNWLAATARWSSPRR
jgi:hypothetical protein